MSVGVAFYTAWSTEPATADDGLRKLLTGSAQDIAEDIQALEALGVGIPRIRLPRQAP